MQERERALRLLKDKDHFPSQYRKNAYNNTNDYFFDT